ncbi:MAG: transglycosylase domain-containing protein [Saprospiraceae bacterium]|nr:transglycosylase domain-containing protein [Saprospiraceae bacterium]
MENPFRSIFNHPFIQQAARWWKEWTAPLRAILADAWAFADPVLQPVYQAWAWLTAPLRRAWSTFAARYPNPAWALGWLGAFLKWGFLVLMFLVFLVWIGAFGHIPGRTELKNIETANATEVYTADSVLIGKFYIENRTAIGLDKVSPHVINALIATEDRRFFEHSGIDLYSWGRVLYGMATGKESMGGGSTLSQQLAKNLYPRQKHRVLGLYISPVSLLINKIREYLISVRLESIYSKEELLGLYLNTVPFGGDLFGISVAAKQYFNKKAKDLSPDQAATLIGMLKATTYYNPNRNPENAQKRRNVVLRQMVKNGHLTEKEFNDLSVKPVGAKRYSSDGNNEGMGTYFREHLRTDIMPQLLKKIGQEDGNTYNLYTDGLKIYTTLNSKMQQYAEEAVEEHMSKLQKQFDDHWKNAGKERPWGDDKWIEETVRRSDRWTTLKESGWSDDSIRANFEKPVSMTIFSWKNGGAEVDTLLKPIDSVRYYFCLLNCGFLALEHQTGFVRAWVGGTNFRHFKYDHIKSSRQAGSTFKPIVYAAALLDSVKPCDYIPNQLVMIKDWEPHNYNDNYGGWYSVAGGLQKSVNVIAAQLIERVGIQKTIDLAQSMGVTAKLPREFGISLGACEVSLYDMIKVYGTIANNGKRPEPVMVLKVTTREGNVLYDYKRELAKNAKLGPHVAAMNPDQAAVMRKMMQNVIDRGTGERLRGQFGITGDFAGKTGTTQNQADGWFLCFNPTLVTGSWVGGETRAVRFRSMNLGQGAAMALPIVGHFWRKMLLDKKLSALVNQKFEPLKPEIEELFGCPSWIGIHPDTLYLFQQDSVLFDSLRARNFRAFDGYQSLLPGAEGEPASGEGDPIPTTPDPAAPKPAGLEPRRDEPLEKMLPHKPGEGKGNNN